MPKIELPKIDLKKIDLPEIPAAAEKPVYAGVGAADLAYETVKAYVADVQAKVTAKVNDVRGDVTSRVADVQSAVKGFEVPAPKSLQDKALAVFTDNKTKAEARFAALQADAAALPAKVQGTVKGNVDKNVATATALYADLATRGEGVVVKIRTGETTKPAAKKAPATKAAAKKAPAKKAAATKAPAKKAPAKKA